MDPADSFFQALDSEQLLKEHGRSLGVECEVFYPGAPDLKHQGNAAFLIDKLKAP